MAVAPPCGAQTESRPRGSPPLGSTLSSAAIPVATCSVVCAPPVRGVASGKRCSISARRAAMDVDMGRRSYTEHNPKARSNPHLDGYLRHSRRIVILTVGFAPTIRIHVMLRLSIALLATAAASLQAQKQPVSGGRIAAETAVGFVGVPVGFAI